MTIIVSGSLQVDPAQRDAYLEARVPILAHARQAPGCLDFSLRADLLDADRINVYERWRSTSAPRRRRSRGRSWHAATCARSRWSPTG
jgi:quinol monooxygenase YgiN